MVRDTSLDELNASDIEPGSSPPPLPVHLSGTRRSDNDQSPNSISDGLEASLASTQLVPDSQPYNQEGLLAASIPSTTFPSSYTLTNTPAFARARYPYNSPSSISAPRSFATPSIDFATWLSTQPTDASQGTSSTFAASSIYQTPLEAAHPRPLKRKAVELRLPAAGQHSLRPSGSSSQDSDTIDSDDILHARGLSINDTVAGLELAVYHMMAALQIQIREARNARDLSNLKTLLDRFMCMAKAEVTVPDGPKREWTKAHNLL